MHSITGITFLHRTHQASLTLTILVLHFKDYIVASCCTVLFDNFIGYVAVFRAALL
jgi:hypothetical protein